jgi:Fur family ferric uptake transcriptional regulator
LILADLQRRQEPCTAAELFEAVRSQLPGLNRATVYRTLALLQAAGQVAAFEGRHGLTEFEWTRGGDCHRLHCRRCGVGLALEAAPVEALRAEILQRHGFHAELEHLHISGLCAVCAAA